MLFEFALAFCMFQIRIKELEDALEQERQGRLRVSKLTPMSTPVLAGLRYLLSGTTTLSSHMTEDGHECIGATYTLTCISI